VFFTKISRGENFFVGKNSKIGSVKHVLDKSHFHRTFFFEKMKVFKGHFFTANEKRQDEVVLSKSLHRLTRS
jgi:hypothetical protein